MVLLLGTVDQQVLKNKLSTLLIIQFKFLLWKITKGGSILLLCMVTDLQAG